MNERLWLGIGSEENNGQIKNPGGNSLNAGGTDVVWSGNPENHTVPAGRGSTISNSITPEAEAPEVLSSRPAWAG